MHPLRSLSSSPRNIDRRANMRRCQCGRCWELCLCMRLVNTSFYSYQLTAIDKYRPESSLKPKFSPTAPRLAHTGPCTYVVFDYLGTYFPGGGPLYRRE